MRPSPQPWFAAVLLCVMIFAPELAAGDDDDSVPPGSTVPPPVNAPAPDGRRSINDRSAGRVVGDGAGASDVRVSAPYQALAEVLIDVNPVNERNLVICGHAMGPYMATFCSFDGGATWSMVPVGHDQDRLGADRNRFDPALAFDADGNVYVAYGVNVPVGIIQRTTVVVARSSDGGMHYTQTAFVWAANGVLNVLGNDKWVLATGRDHAVPERQNVYIAWTWNVPTANSNVDQQVAVSASLDGGATFTPPVVVNDNSLTGRDRALTCDPSVGPDGELYVSWHDFDNSARVMVDRSFDGGVTWGGDVVVTTNAVGWKTPIPPQPDRGTSSAPVMDVDVSPGPHRGRAYIAYCHPTAQALDILLRYSDDQAATWSEPVRVNDDATNRIQFLPWLDVGRRNGTISVVFYDTREDNRDHAAKVYAAISRTGGESFEPNRALADAPSNMSVDNPERYLGNYLEYIGVATGDCAAYAVWTDNRHQWPVRQSYELANYYFDRVPLDETPPVLDVTLTPDVLWPPDHRMVDIHATVEVADGCAAPADLVWSLWSVSANEAEDDSGDGRTWPDISNAEPGTPDADFSLRAERSGSDDGRRYQIVFRATDSANETYDTVYVTVPHDTETGGVPAIEHASGAGVPVKTALRDARPNPFNPETTIGFDLASPERVRLMICDVSGARVRLLVDQNQPGGAHVVRWDGRDDSGQGVSSGVYFVRMQAGAYASVRKLVLLK